MVVVEEDSAFHQYTDREEYYSEFMNFMSDSHSMKHTAKSAIKQTLVTGGCAMTGSLVFGPVGGLVGGIVGSVYAYLKSDDYDGAIKALTLLESSRQKRLMTEVLSVLKKAGASIESFDDLNAFKNTLYTFAEQDEVRNGIWNACINSTRS